MKYRCWIDEFKRITCVITFHFITMHSHYWFIFHVILYVVVDVFKYRLNQHKRALYPLRSSRAIPSDIFCLSLTQTRSYS
jgi:hypothetical protein